MNLQWSLVLCRIQLMMMWLWVWLRRRCTLNEARHHSVVSAIWRTRLCRPSWRPNNRKPDTHVGPVPTHYAAVHLEQRGPNPNPHSDFRPFELKTGTPPVTPALRIVCTNFGVSMFSMLLRVRVWSPYGTGRQTDGRTDGQDAYCGGGLLGPMRLYVLFLLGCHWL